MAGPLLYELISLFIYICVTYVETYFSHGAFDENVCFPIRTHLDSLERQEQNSGGVRIKIFCCRIVYTKIRYVYGY